MSVVAPIVFGLGLLYSLLVLFFVLKSYDLDKEERGVCFTLVVVLPLCVGLCLSVFECHYLMVSWIVLRSMSVVLPLHSRLFSFVN